MRNIIYEKQLAQQQLLEAYDVDDRLIRCCLIDDGEDMFSYWQETDFEIEVNEEKWTILK